MLQLSTKKISLKSDTERRNMLVLVDKSNFRVLASTVKWIA